MSHVKTNCDKNENIKLDKSGVKLLRQVLYEIENSLYCPKEDKEMVIESELEGTILIKGETLFDELENYLDLYKHESHSSSPVNWLENDDGELLISVKGEYVKEFKEFLEKLK